MNEFVVSGLDAGARRYPALFRNNIGAGGAQEKI